MGMKWITNIYDPSREDAQDVIYKGWSANREQAWAVYLSWLEDKVIGEPMASDEHSVEELKAKHYVGVYVP